MVLRFCSLLIIFKKGSLTSGSAGILWLFEKGHLVSTHAQPWQEHSTIPSGLALMNSCSQSRNNPQLHSLKFLRLHLKISKNALKACCSISLPYLRPGIFGLMLIKPDIFWHKLHIFT